MSQVVSSSQDQAQPASSISPDLVASAHECAAASARHAGVVVRSVDDMVDLQAVSQLLAAVWGRTPEGVPVHSEVMRSIVHAGGCTTAAYDYLGELVGGAVLSPGAQPGSTYSLIAAAAPGSADRGIGYAVKLAQRACALDSGLNTMVWTFDPLVGRNGRFNLAKLGAHAREYDVSFYGQMSDDLNGGDDADRLVATWVLDCAGDRRRQRHRRRTTRTCAGCGGTGRGTGRSADGPARRNGPMDPGAA